ncbi:hypothetical protein DENSPDRAFT_624568 [Dentipellis sp. KUC8613]|nr:hypothetical protein DENSPDRAFT_624568 [Dentipellis sp. KUC8613]
MPSTSSARRTPSAPSERCRRPQHALCRLRAPSAASARCPQPPHAVRCLRTPSAASARPLRCMRPHAFCLPETCGCLVFSFQWYVVFSIPEAFIDIQYEPFELLFTIEQSGHYFPILGVLIVVVYYSFCILV